MTMYYDVLRRITPYCDVVDVLRRMTYYDVLQRITPYFDMLRRITTYYTTYYDALPVCVGCVLDGAA